MMHGPINIRFEKEEMGGFRSLSRENVCRILSRKEVNKFSTRLDINCTLSRRQPVGSDEYIFSARFGRK